MSDANEIRHLLFTEFDKPERLRALAQIADRMDERHFWRLFGRVWAGSESLFLDQEIITEMLRHRERSPYRGLMMNHVERAALRGMADSFTVYRGCFSGNRQGWSWTVEFDKAVFFAQRYAGDLTAYVVAGTVQKLDVIAYLNGRDEREIVVDPRHVRKQKIIHRLPKQPRSHTTWAKGMYLLAQTGKLDEMFPKQAMREMRVRMYRQQGMTLDKMLALFQERIDILTRYDFLEKAAEWVEFQRVARDVFAGDGMLPDGMFEKPLQVHPISGSGA